MTEREWLEATALAPLLAAYLRVEHTDRRPPASHRKLRLFACACVRRVWHLLTDDVNRSAVEVAERYADGLAKEKELAAAHAAAQEARGLVTFHSGYGQRRYGFPRPERKWQAAAAVIDAVVWATHPSAVSAAAWAADAASLAVAHLHGLGEDPGESPVRCAEQRDQCDLLRDVVGRPPRPVTIECHWLTADAVAVARAVYDARDFSDLPVLADALEEAGCLDEDILRHCRGGGDHARGCWVVDGVLGKK